jgi:hypothetical protein
VRGDTPDLEPLDGDLRRLLEAEAYRQPVRLTGPGLAARVAAADRDRASWRRWAALASAAAVAALAVVIGVSSQSTRPAPPGGAPSQGAAACDASPATVHGSWWSEVGGPNAFFNIEPGTRRATNAGETWLLHVRFDPDAPESLLELSATDLATGVRLEGVLNSRADPGSIFGFDQPAPPLSGGWYLFELRVPAVGCWRLDAAIDGALAGSAVVEVRPNPGPEATAAADGLPDRIGCSGVVETGPASGPAAPATNCLAALELVRAAYPDLVSSAWAAIVEPMCPPQSDCDFRDPYTIAVVLLAPPSSSAGWLAYLVVGEAGPERVGEVAVDLPAHILDGIRAHGIPGERTYRLECGPIEPVRCATRAYAVIRAGEGPGPARVESVRFRDENGSYTMRFEDGNWVTGIFD